MTLGHLDAWNGREGAITSDDGEVLRVHAVDMPRYVQPQAGMRVSFLRDDGELYARSVLIILDGAKPEPVEQYSKFRSEVGS